MLNKLSHIDIKSYSSVPRMRHLFSDKYNLCIGVTKSDGAQVVPGALTHFEPKTWCSVSKIFRYMIAVMKQEQTKKTCTSKALFLCEIYQVLLF